MTTPKRSLSSTRIESPLPGLLQVRHQLSESEGRFRLFVDCVRDYAIFMLDLTGRVVSWNRGAERIKGYRSEEIIGQHLSRFYTPEDIERGLPSRLLKLASTEGRVENEGWRVRKDGSRFWADVVITAIQNEKGELQGFGKVTRDLTEKRHAEKSLSELYSQLLDAQEQEQKRISLALNDSTSPAFVSLVSKLYRIKNQAQGSVPQLVDDSIALAEFLFREIRTFSYLLHPPMLHKEGLLSTLRSCLHTFAEQRGVTVDLELPMQLERLPHSVEIVLYRIVHECLTSILHSSGSTGGKVRLISDQENLRIEVGDQGPGLSVQQLEQVNKGVGELGVAIAGMRERITLLGGHLDISSSKSCTLIIANLPLPSGKSLGLM